MYSLYRALAVSTLHGELLKVLQIFFDNFQSDFRAQEVTRDLRAADVEDNTDICQFHIAALYKLQLSWLTMYVRICGPIQTHI